MNDSELRRAVDRLLDQVRHWTPARWTQPAAGSGGSRADAVHALVQRLADRAADAEGQPRRPVPRLDNDLSLPDQLRVVVADLLTAAPAEDVVDAGAADVTEVRRRL